MSKERGFLEIQRKEPGYRSKDQRLKDYHAVELRLTDEELYQQANRCMDCGTPFCHGCGCPLWNVIPEFNDHIYNHRWKEALDILLTTNPFPEFMGRICPALCEGSCVLGINAEPVTIRQIELAIIEKGFERGYIVPQPPQMRNNMSVAVIGSGPAGLAVAEVLNKHGYSIVVYENHAKPGGILRYGIPEFKLEKWVVDRRIKLMQDEGVVFETGVEVGKDLSYRFLQGRYNAVVLTGGAREPRDLKIPGRDLKGIHYAMTYLIQQNKRLNGEPIKAEDEIFAKDKTVVIIGGGDTGADCLGTALRQGAKKVYQFEILPKPPEKRDPNTPWPMWPNMLRESSSHKEGGERRWCIDTKEFLGENGNVKRMRCVEVEWVRQQGGKGPVPKEKPGTEFTVDANLVLLAMGFVGPGKNKMVEELGVEFDKRGFIKRNENNMTNIPGLFVAGDMTQGASLVVRAMADGIQTANGVMSYLSPLSLNKT
jgi:glutamate synthase (NADPH/NADH) small chain